MALGTYSELQSAIASWSFNRTDLPATDLITLGEARLNRDLRLRAMEAEESITGVVGTRTYALPSDFNLPIAVWRNDTLGRVYIQRVSGPLAVSETNGSPDYWTIEGESLGFERPCDDDYSYTLRYLARFALSAESPTNWLLTNHPDAYLAAAIVEAALWAADDEQAVRWQQRYQAAVDAINHRESKAREAPLRTEIAAQGGFDINKG